MWAVVKTGGKQYKVEEGQQVIVEKLDGGKDSKVTLDKILAVGGDKVAIGTPYVEGAKVNAKIISTFKDKKIRVVKFKPKSRYMRTGGARHVRTRLLVEKIQF